LTYTITNGNTGDAFAIDEATGEITVAAALDFETTPNYSLTVEVDDGNATDDATITITVTDMGEATPCHPYSTLTCAETHVELPFDLDFEAASGGLDDTGFTLVDPPSNRDEPQITQDPAPETPTFLEVPGYEPGLLEVVDGELTITATKGIQYATPDPVGGQQTSGAPGLNALINGLGVAVPTGDDIYELTTTVVAPNFNTDSGNSQQAGLSWFVDEDTYIKLVVVRQTNTQNKVQLAVESLDAPTADASDGFHELNGPNFANGEDVSLRMVVDTTTNTVQGFYTVAGGTEQTVAPSGQDSLIVPAALTDGFALETGLDPTIHAGLFATKRAAPAEQTMTANLADFGVTGSEAPNTSPSVDPIADVIAEVDTAITPIPVTVTDADGDPVTVTVVPLPPGISYDEVATEVTGTPTDLGTTTVTVTADDGTDTATEEFDITVVEEGATFAANINFNTVDGEQPADYELDFGEPYGDRGNGLNYGWLEADDGETPLSLISNGRDRNTSQPDQRLDTLLHMQADDITSDGGTFNGIDIEGVWEIAVPNGTYEVTVAAGDPAVNNYVNDPEIHSLNVEGVEAIAPFEPTGPEGSDTHHDTGTVTVTVSDGLLTVDAFGGTNTKINYIDIISTVPGGNTAPEVILTGDRTLFDGQDTIIPVGTFDEDGDTVSVDVAGLPTGLVYADGFISGTVDLDASTGSPYTVTVTGDDGNGGTDVGTFTIEVIEEVALDINFQAENDDVPSGYLRDFGQAFGARTGADQGTGLTYGWVSEGTTEPLDMVGNGRDRNRTSGPAATDQRLDTLIHMQYGDIADVYGGTANCTASQCEKGAWEIELPDGLYEVALSVGDQPSGTNGYDSLHAINVETGLAILEFQATGAQEYLEATAEAGVEDGRLTINAIGGANTKINYIQIRSLGTQPFATTMIPPNRAVDVDPVTAVSASVNVPGSGLGVNPSIEESLTEEAVKLFEVTPTGEVEIDGNRGSTGGNDTIAISPLQPLKENTRYRFQIDGVIDEAGNTFGKFQTTFVTGEEDDTEPTEFEEVTGVDFEKVLLPEASGNDNGKFIASMQVHEGYLWYTTVGQGMYRHEIQPDGTLGPAEDLDLFKGRANIGLVFDENDPNRAWVTHATANLGNEGARFGSKVSTVDFTDIDNPVVEDVFINLPRSMKDHLSNSIIYGPSGGGGHNWLYFLQGSNQAAGDVDGAWGNRGETQLTAALLRFDPVGVLAEVQANGPIDVETEEGDGTYDPFAPDAPLEIYATGIRNAYDLVWHSNGHIYVPTNGTAGGANSPGVDIDGTVGAGGTATMVSNQGPGENGYGDGVDVTDACLNHRVDGQPYFGGDVPAVSNWPTQRDYLFDVVEGGYYGHPNPTRCEWTLNQGSANPQGGDTKYPAGTDPDPNYRGFAYDFITNKSPNGVLEYQTASFDGKLQGRVMVVRFSNNDDILTMQAANNGDILGAQAGTTIGGFAGGYVDPLEIVEDTSVNPGNIYINQYNRAGEPQQLYLLRVPDDQSASNIAVQPDELIMSATLNNDGPTDTETVTVTNTGDDEVVVTISGSGDDAADFTTPATVTVPADGETEVDILFDPNGTETGVRTATVDFAAADNSDTVSIRALAHQGQEGNEEPTLQQVFDTLEYALDTGWDGLAGGTTGILGDEVEVDLFTRASDGPVVVTPIASFAPFEDLPFGWVSPDGTLNEVGTLPNGQQQTLLPDYTPAGSLEFDPGTSDFGFYYESNTFNRVGYTEDARNIGAVAHRARIYPLSGDDYIVAFEDAANGDYQDYVFLLENVAPATEDPPPPSGEAIKVNFQTEDAEVPDGYLRDFGEAFGPRTGAEGTGLSYGWLDANDGTPEARTLTGRDRDLQDDLRLDTLMHLQYGVIANPSCPPNNCEDGMWEMAVGNGTWEVTAAVGDASVGSDPEEHMLRAEGTELFDEPYIPTGAAGSATRHSTGSAIVEVTDGTMTIDAIGGFNTKINHIELQPLGGGGETVAQVNFQPAGSPTPDGWVADSGLLFDAGRGYGWVNTEGGSDKTADTRDRAADADPLTGTLIIVDDAVVAAISDGEWEYALANGTYTVTLSAGDPEFADSTHGFTAEGVSVIDGFVPSGPGDYQTGTATVEVTDGRLTLASTGNNSKVQWLTISSNDGTDVIPPQVEIILDAPGSGGTVFGGPVTVTLDISDATLEFVEVVVDGVVRNDIDITNYDEPFEVSGTGEHTVEVTATDGASNSTEESVTFEIVETNDGSITLTNPEAALFHDRLVMSRIESDVDNPKTNETASLTLGNNGIEDLVITSLDIADDDFELVNPPTLPLTIPVGGTTSIQTNFVGVGSGQHQLFESTIQVTHDGSNGPVTTVELAGMWQTQEEGGNEPDVAEIVQAFGFGTTINNTGEQINNQGRLEAIGDEVLSQTWQRADTDRPITVRQLAAYHTCCNNTATFKWHQVGNKGAETGVVTHDGEWAQTLLPRINGSDTNPVLDTFTPGPATFSLSIDPESSDWTLNNSGPDDCGPPENDGCQ
ncbi:MAG: hypothetical protein GEU79_13240, partial [Acidimicrobiia bacterium]|nr:hypothetical protein [Acidimicrobiia bacterium]